MSQRFNEYVDEYQNVHIQDKELGQVAKASFSVPGTLIWRSSLLQIKTGLRSPIRSR